MPKRQIHAKFTHHMVPVKLLDYFLQSEESNIS